MKFSSFQDLGAATPKSKFQMLTSTGIGPSFSSQRPVGSGLSALVAPAVSQRPHFVESKYCRELVEEKFDEVGEDVHSLLKDR